MIDYAKAVGVKVVISSIMSVDRGWVVDCYWMLKWIPLATIYKQAFSICSKLDGVIVETPKEAKYMRKHYHIDNEILKSVVPNGANDVSSKDESIYSALGKKWNMHYLCQDLIKIKIS